VRIIHHRYNTFVDKGRWVLTPLADPFLVLRVAVVGISQRLTALAEVGLDRIGSEWDLTGIDWIRLGKLNDGFRYPYLLSSAVCR